MVHFRRVAAACLCAAHIGAVMPVSLRAQAGGEWPYFGGDHAFTRYSPLEQIDRSNVDRLEVVWRRPGADPSFTASFDEFLYALFLGGNHVTLPVFMFTQTRFPDTLPTVLALGSCIFLGSGILLGTAEWLRRMGSHPSTN